jgi:hypothetical protein
MRSVNLVFVILPYQSVRNYSNYIFRKTLASGIVAVMAFSTIGSGIVAAGVTISAGGSMVTGAASPTRIWVRES